jgi:hypothetical protein
MIGLMLFWCLVFGDIQINAIKQVVSLMAIIYPSLAFLLFTMMVRRQTAILTSALIPSMGILIWLLLFAAEPLRRTVMPQSYSGSLPQYLSWYLPLLFSFILPSALLLKYSNSAVIHVRWIVSLSAFIFTCLMVVGLFTELFSNVLSTPIILLSFLVILVIGMWRLGCGKRNVALLAAILFGTSVFKWKTILIAGVFYGSGLPFLLLAFVSLIVFGIDRVILSKYSRATD